MPGAPLQLIERLRRHGRQRGDAPAYLAAGGARLTYAALADGINVLADRLRGELAPGVVVVLSAANQITFPIAFFGILAAGCSVFPVSCEAADGELVRAATESGGAGVIGDERAVAVLAPMVGWAAAIADVPGGGTVAFSSAAAEGLKCRLRAPREANPHAEREDYTEEASENCQRPCGGLLLQSSGTTGVPKIIRRSGASLDCAADAMVESIGFCPDDRVLMTVPLTHSYGLEHGLLAPVWAGSSVALCRGLDLPLVREFLAQGVSLFPGVPSTFEMLARSPDAMAMPRLRRAYSAGGALPPSVFDAFAARFDVRVSQLYGASEIGSVTFEPQESDADPASVGRAMKGVSIRILDLDGSNRPLPPGCEGQIAVAAGSMFTGYLNGPTDLIDGHFVTGDLGRLDESGRLFLTGRIKLLIDVGGLKVNPLEVEAVLAEHPSVAACVVIPVRQSETVFRLKAIVTPRESGGTVPLDELRALARQRLSGWKIPRLYEVRDSFPRSPNGKILRHLIENT